MLRNRTNPSLSLSPTLPSRREEILERAAILFASSGFAGVTVDDIGAACGISGPALYHHFPSKESILGEMLVSISEHLASTARSIVASAPEPSAALAALVDEHVDFAITRPELITVQARDLVYALDEDRRTVRRLQRRYVESWVEILGELRATSDLSARRAGVHAVFGLLNSTPFVPTVGATELRSLLRQLAHGALASMATTNQGAMSSS